MKRILEFIFSGCWHVWEVYEKHDYFKDSSDMPFSYKYILRCKKCGELRESKPKRDT